MDYYSVLGVSKDSSQGDIKKAYRKLAVEYHPDKNPGDAEAEEKFKEISEAYSILGDEGKRRAYDNPGMFSKGIPINIMDLFGFGPRPQPGTPVPRHGRTVKIEDAIPLTDALLGGSYEKEVSFESFCDDCQALGGTGWEPCSMCGGSGQSIRSGRTSDNNFVYHSQACSECKGSGGSFGIPCPECSGTAVKRYTAKLSYEVPPGFSATVVKFVGKGGPPIFGGSPGDILLYLSVKIPHIDSDSLSEEDKDKLRDLLA